jgi:hypothetical protein
MPGYLNNVGETFMKMYQIEKPDFTTHFQAVTIIFQGSPTALIDTLWKMRQWTQKHPCTTGTTWNRQSPAPGLREL